MSKARGKKTARANEAPRQTRSALSFGMAQKMVPLVRHIVAEIQSRWDNLTQLEAEQLDLDNRRRGLDWPQRARRYQVAEDISAEQSRLQENVAELEQLEVLLVDPVHGETAFPTLINGRRGYFVWRLGETSIDRWCYAHDATRHAVPPSWRGQG